MNKFIIYILVILLTSCAEFATKTYQPTKYKIDNNFTKTKTPEGKNYNWRFLGNNYQYKIVDEIDENSIKEESAQIFVFAERKTFGDNQLSTAKFSINKVKIFCQAKTYTILHIANYNKSGNIIFQKSLDLSPISIPSNSFAGQQYSYVCAGKAREIGY